ncbi:MAG: dephospho-CoA kinase [Gammaproteobacteria bacterium]|jgi:dephospho-CoA kinase
MNRPYCVGLTGGIGSGKTSATDIFSELGVPIIDADAISREVVQSGQPAFEEIISLFGAEVIGDNGQLRRDRLRKIIFDDLSARQKLESIIHPRVHSEISRRVNQVTFPYYIISSPLLLESRSLHNVDRILVLDVPETLQIERASRRDNLSEDDIKLVLKTQIGRQERLDAADDVIANDRDLSVLRQKVEKLHKTYLEISAQKMLQ